MSDIKINENLPSNLQYQDPQSLNERRAVAIEMMKEGKGNKEIISALKAKYSIALGASWISGQRARLMRARSKDQLRDKIEYAKQLFARGATYREVEAKVRTKFGSNIPHNKVIEVSKAIRGNLRPGRRKGGLYVVQPRISNKAIDPPPPDVSADHEVESGRADMVSAIVKMAVADGRTVTVHPDGVITIK